MLLDEHQRLLHEDHQRLLLDEHQRLLLEEHQKMALDHLQLIKMVIQYVHRLKLCEQYDKALEHWRLVILCDEKRSKFLIWIKNIK